MGRHKTIASTIHSLKSHTPPPHGGPQSILESQIKEIIPPPPNYTYNQENNRHFSWLYLSKKNFFLFFERKNIFLSQNIFFSLKNIGFIGSVCNTIK